MLTGRKIILGITGSISAYKAPTLVREMVKRGAEVRCVLTKNALRFVTKETLEVVTGNPVLCDMWDVPSGHEIPHISWARWADTIVIAPATLNFIGKITSGIADDLLTAMTSASQAPVLIAPAMNTNMYKNRIFQNNLEQLRENGFNIISAAFGELACGEIGEGRLAEIPDILDSLLYLKLHEHPLKVKTAIVTAGPTREMIDPVRFLSNPSTGKMGFEMARVLRARGAEVKLISGPSTLAPPFGVELIKIKSAKDMEDAVKTHITEADILVMTSAVADWKAQTIHTSKIKKSSFDGVLNLTRTKDILSEISGIQHNALVVGFALETDDSEDNGLIKLKEKSLDMIIVNTETPESGFASDYNSGIIIDRFGKKTDIPSMGKFQMAEMISQKIEDTLNQDEINR